MIDPAHPALVLAPMEGITDAPMRALQGESGAFTYAVSEFLRISQEIPPRRVFLRHVPELEYGSRTPSGMPVHVQLLGGDPERMALAAERACQAGAIAIDLNFGCPARTVNRHDGGATLLKSPQRIRTIVSAVRASVPTSVPVSAKLRLGWDDMKAIHSNAESAAEGGASWITIHGRTKEQGYRPPAYWGPIGEVRRRIGIPVVANGDIWTIEDFLRCRDETGCQHFMIGRGALADPWLPLRIAHELGILTDFQPQPMASLEAWMPWLRRFRYWSEHFPTRSPEYLLPRVKQWLRLAHSRGTITWFDRIKHYGSVADLCSGLGL